MNAFCSLVLAFSLTALSLPAFADNKASEKWFRSLVGADLLNVQRNDIAGKDTKQIEKLNEQSFKMLNDYQPADTDGRATTISEDFAKLVLKSINANPVVSEYNTDQYPNGHQIGFCFGRATYVHLALLKAGVNKRSIKKIWAVGPMRTGGINWQFHVATVAKGDDGRWLVMDMFVGKVVTPEEWFKKMQGVATDKTLLFYATEPKKFSVSLSTYDRIQLGLDLPKSQDWYSHYFVDLMTWTRTKELKDYGLYDLTPADTISDEED